MLRVTPVYGSRFDADGSAEPPTCTLVEYGGVRVLWNVGWWGESSSSSSTETSFPSLPDHDCLIVSDSTLNSLGGLPLYLEHHYKAKNLHIPLYATFPTVKMGHMTLYDHHASISLDGGKPPYTLEQMDDAMAKLHTIKFSQTMTIWGQDQEQPSLSITAYRAGHVVGGAFFVLQRLQDETIVVLTPPTYNIAKETHLDSATLLKHGAAPDVLVTYPGGPAFRYANPLYNKKGIMKFAQTRSTAIKTLLEMVLSVLRRDGHVLLPVDASGRVLELVLLLSQHWDRQRLGQAYNLVWLGPMVQNTLDYSRSQLEWMANQLGTQFEDGNQGKGQHPFSLRNVHLCANIQQFDAVIRQNNNNPTCVLASGLSLDHGPARDLLLRWADNADHAIIFTDSSRCFARRTHVTQAAPEPVDRIATATTATHGDEEATPVTAMARQVSVTTADDPDPDQDDEDNENTLIVGSALTAEDKISPYCAAAQLLQQWCLAKWEGREMDDVVLVDVNVPVRSPLAGQELKTFLAEEEAKRQLQKQQEEKRAMLREVELAKGRLRLGEQQQEETITAADSKKSKASTPATSKRPKKKSRFDSSLFLKFSKPLHRKCIAVQFMMDILRNERMPC
jgi:cleavage and polyadenylation specificity factor subunit 2